MCPGVIKYPYTGSVDSWEPAHSILQLSMVTSVLLKYSCELEYHAMLEQKLNEHHSILQLRKATLPLYVCCYPMEQKWTQKTWWGIASPWNGKILHVIDFHSQIKYIVIFIYWTISVVPKNSFLFNMLRMSRSLSFFYFWWNNVWNPNYKILRLVIFVIWVKPM